MKVAERDAVTSAGPETSAVSTTENATVAGGLVAVLVGAAAVHV